ncbi:MAG: hypothetical protein C0603_01610 [Denitrovibrio sp.]|nr:MAG: hypothetical protein C0603_01610 [Denitrovibrio sp.]
MIKVLRPLSIRCQIFIVIFVFAMVISFSGAFTSYIFRINQAQENLIDIMEDKYIAGESILLNDLSDMKNMLFIVTDYISHNSIKSIDEVKNLR